jgi:hypothetical protein
MESAFKEARLIQWALLATIPLFAWVAEIGRGSGSSDWDLATSGRSFTR